MEALKVYLKTLPDDDARDDFARRCETTLGHMRNCMYSTTKRLAPDVCVLIEKNSGGAVKRWDVRPQDWRRFWPELNSWPDAPPAEVDLPQAA